MIFSQKWCVWTSAPETATSFTKRAKGKSHRFKLMKKEKMVGSLYDENFIQFDMKYCNKSDTQSCVGL